MTAAKEQHAMYARFHKWVQDYAALIGFVSGAVGLVSAVFGVWAYRDANEQARVQIAQQKKQLDETRDALLAATEKVRGQGVQLLNETEAVRNRADTLIEATAKLESQSASLLVATENTQRQGAALKAEAHRARELVDFVATALQNQRHADFERDVSGNITGVPGKATLTGASATGVAQGVRATGDSTPKAPQPSQAPNQPAVEK